MTPDDKVNPDYFRAMCLALASNAIYNKDYFEKLMVEFKEDIESGEVFKKGWPSYDQQR